MFLLHEVGGNAFLFQDLHQRVAHLIVYNAFAHDSAFLKAVERGSVVLVRYDQKFRIVRFEYFLCFALV